MGKKKLKRGVASQAVRDYLTEHPAATAAEVVPALAEKGIPVTNTLVNSIRSDINKKGKRKPGKKQGRGTGITADELLQAKELVNQLGGFSAAKQAIEFLEQLQ